MPALPLVSDIDLFGNECLGLEEQRTWPRKPVTSFYDPKRNSGDTETRGVM
jgi:hypothetical protein